MSTPDAEPFQTRIERAIEDGDYELASELIEQGDNYKPDPRQRITREMIERSVIDYSRPRKATVSFQSPKDTQ